jgi:NDP-sugar pyrophosphorylase family protein
MRPITLEIPKHKLPIKGKSNYERIKQRLKEAGIKNVTNNYGEVLENDIRGTAGSIKVAMNNMKWREHLLVWMGDVFVEDFLPYQAIISDVDGLNKNCDIMIFGKANTARNFITRHKKGRLYFNNKGEMRYKKSRVSFKGGILNSGIMVFSSTMKDYLPKYGDIDKFLKCIVGATGVRTRMCIVPDEYHDMGTLKDYENLLKRLSKNEL